MGRLGCERLVDAVDDPHEAGRLGQRLGVGVEEQAPLHLTSSWVTDIEYLGLPVLHRQPLAPRSQGSLDGLDCSPPGHAPPAALLEASRLQIIDWSID